MTGRPVGNDSGYPASKKADHARAVRGRLGLSDAPKARVAEFAFFNGDIMMSAFDDGAPLHYLNAFGVLILDLWSNEDLPYEDAFYTAIGVLNDAIGGQLALNDGDDDSIPAAAS